MSDGLDFNVESTHSTTTVLPVVEAQQSDIREEVVPATQQQVDNIKAEQRDPEALVDSDFATGLNTSAVDNTIAPASESIQVDALPASPVVADLPLHLPGESKVVSTSDPDKDIALGAPEPAIMETSRSGQNLTHASSPPTTDSGHELPSVSTLELTSQPQTDLASTTPETKLELTSVDTSMMDAPSPAKVSRERDEDMEDEPSAKRTKVHTNGDGVPEFAMPDAPNGIDATTTTNDSDNLPPSQHQVKETLKALRHYKGTINGRNFKAPVSILWPTFAAAYAEKVTNPVDLGLIDQRLKDGYASIADLKHDFNQIYENALLFNGPDHGVTQSAATTRDYMLSKIPAREPPKQEKKMKKEVVKAESAPRAIPARRQSRGAAAGSPPAVVVAPQQTFALDPSGTPLIRRDSTKGDGGRPKREIHPPKSKDLIYNSRPKKKKFATELKFCDQVLTELKKPKYQPFNTAFLVPVDPVALSIPDYYNIIKKPMDLSTVTTRLEGGQYDTAKEFEADIRQIFKNCYKFNPIGTPVHEWGRKLEDIFDAEWTKKSQYIADHTVPSNAASPTSYGDTDDEESEEEVEEEATSGTSAAAQRLIEEQNKLIDLMASKKPNPDLIKMQQEMVGIAKRHADAESAKPKKKVAKPKPVKKGAAVAGKKKIEKKSGYRPKHIGQAEKELISNGMGALEGKDLEKAVALLKVDFPDLNVSLVPFLTFIPTNTGQVEDELELDIDSFSSLTLSRLHDLIIRAVPSLVPEPVQAPPRAAKPATKKKNKPMSKFEQEKNIERLRQLAGKFESKSSPDEDRGAVVPCEFSTISIRHFIPRINI
jgi:bromodomain-containing factor 1